MNSFFVILSFVSAVFGAREKWIVYNSDENQTGTIHSKDYPYSYTPTEIEIFEFKGRQNENVQITFEYFNLFPKTTNEKCGIESSFITYKKTSRSTEWEKLCGDKKPLPIMSEEENFILRYVPIVVPLNMRDQVERIGFNATFRFVKNFGVEYKILPNDPRLSDPFGYRCDFSYESEYSPSGLINSPNFPGMFPDRIRCFYTFSGPETYIKFQFTHFNLSGSNDCKDEIETKDKLQILTSMDGAGSSDEKLEYCGSMEPFEVTITNRTAFLIFYHQTSYSDNDLAGSQFVGFNASYLFTNDTTNNSACDHRLSGVSFFCVCLFLTMNQLLHF